MTGSSLQKHEESQRSYYNEIAFDYDAHYSNAHALKYRHQLFDSFLQNINLKGHRVLDAMCGGGQTSSYFKDKECELYGIDISENQIYFYNKRYPDAQAHCGSVLNMPYEDNYFDIIVCESLHHLQPTVSEGMSEITRVLKPNGLFLSWEPSAGSLLDFFRSLWYKWDKKYFEDNEAAIDLELLKSTNEHRLKLLKSKYGGSFGYLLTTASMQFRIPPNWVNIYAKYLIKAENAVQFLHGRWFCCWFIALFIKKSS